MPERQTPPNNVTPSYDALTRVLTRPSFLVVLREQARQAQQTGYAFCTCLVDVDQLQNINDQCGLGAGDKTLAALTERLRVTLEQPGWDAFEHTLARYDGDALIVLARPCNLDQGERLAEALRFHVAQAPVHQGIGITVSIGVAQFRIGESIDNLLARTERALHVAKQFGGDRVEISTTPRLRGEPAKLIRLRG